MRKKIAKLLVLMTMFAILPIYKTQEVKAATSKTVYVEKIWTGKKDYVENPVWETFNNNYGTYPKTYEYDDGEFKGTLTATRIKAVPNNKKATVVTGRTSPTLTGNSAPKYVNPSDPAPAFASTISVSYKDPITGVVKTGNIPKLGAPATASVVNENKYISWGRANNYDKVFNTFYGQLSNSSTAFNTTAPLSSVLPKMKFYGDLTVLAHNTNATVNVDNSYINPATGKNAVGMQWAESLIKATTFAANNYTLSALGDGSQQTNNVNNLGKKPKDLLFYPSNVYHFRTEITTIFTTSKDVDLRSQPSASYTKKLTIVKGTPLERTIESNGYIFVLFNGQGGWILKSDTTESDKGGNNYRDYRRGITLLYDLVKYQTSYIQGYSGKLNLDDYISGYYSDNWTIHIEYKGDIIDYRENDIKVNSFTVSPLKSEIPYGGSTAASDLAFTYELEQTHEGKYADATVSPKVEIYQGTNATPIYSGTAVLNKASKKTFTATVNGVNISSGSNTFKIHVNRTKAIVERSLTVSDIYANNVKTATHDGVAPSKINLKVTDLKLTPATGQIAPGEATAKSNIKIDFKITSETSRAGTVNFKPNVTVSFRGTQVWTGIVEVGQNKSATASVTLPNMNFNFGSNGFVVTVNGDRSIVEVVPGVTNPYADNTASINFDGVNPDKYNFKISNLTVSQHKSIIDMDKPNVEDEIAFIFDLEHEISAAPGQILLSPKVEVFFGSTPVWTGYMEIAQGTSSRRTISLPGDIRLYEGTIPVSVVVNRDRFITEYDKSVTNAYADNQSTTNYSVIKYGVCDLPIRKHTTNVWKERMETTTYKGTIVGNACRLTTSTKAYADVEFTETYEITEVYFRSKYTKDMYAKGELYYNALPIEGPGWVKLGTPGALRVKGGYNFELIAITSYKTDRNKQTSSSVKSDYFDGAYGKGYCDVVIVGPSTLTRVNTPNVMYLNMTNSDDSNKCRLIPRDNMTGTRYDQRDIFRITQLTAFGAKAGKYDIVLNTPRSDKPNSFMGYIPENPVGVTNKTYLEDFIQFQIEVLGQDDLKSHIVQ